MTQTVKKEEMKKLLGQHVYALRNDGTVIEGKLVRIKGSELFIAPNNKKGVQTKAFIPLVLFDLLAIGTSPFGFGGFSPFGFGGFGPGFF
jgi:hypothetical protein